MNKNNNNLINNNMKRTILILAVLLLVFTGCRPTLEEKISDEFETYVNKNFDNPLDLEEIVSIKFDSEVNKDSLLSTFYKYKENFIQVDSLKNGMLFYLSDNIKFFPRPLVIELKYEIKDLMDMISRQASDKNDIAFIEHEFSNLDNVTYKVYSIKYRVKESGSIKLKTMYAVIEGESINFHKTNDISIYGSEYETAMKHLTMSSNATLSDMNLLLDLRKVLAQNGFVMK